MKNTAAAREYSRLDLVAPADALAARAGLSLRDVARHWPAWNRRLTAAQIAARVARIRAAARRGGLDPEAAAHLAHLLGCAPQIFLSGAASYSGAVGTRSKDCEPSAPQRSREVCGHNARGRSLRRRPSPPLELI